MTIDNGTISREVRQGIAHLRFGHPKGNSLPGELLRRLASDIEELGRDESVQVIALSSEGGGAFCAGASFDELLSLSDVEQARRFFMGFAQVILAMRDCPRLVVTRVQGKAVGGGVGLIAASDYALAARGAAIKLSEFALGFGPFVIGPAVERKLGKAPFVEASLDTDWKDVRWCERHGLYADVLTDEADLDEAFDELTRKLALSSLEAMIELKRIFWEETPDWPTLLPARAEISARLCFSDFSRSKIEAFKNR